MASDNVSLRDIYEAVNSLENKMEIRMDKMDNRVNALEGFRDKTLGIVAVASLFISLAVNLVWEKLTGRT